MDRPSGGIPSTFAEHARLMFDLQVLAFQCDMTRVITFLMSREVSPRTYTEIGIPDPHHGLSHHQNNAASMEKLAKINTYHVQQLAYFLEKLQATPDGDGTLLDHLTLLYGCGISDSNRHTHDNLPVLVVGGGAGSIKGGRHVRVAPDTPLTNLQLTLLDKVGRAARRARRQHRPRRSGGRRLIDVWETTLDGGTTAPAMTYLHQGKQYIVVATGWTDRPGELVALALP